jgi:uncharacterized protein YkwD
LAGVALFSSISPTAAVTIGQQLKGKILLQVEEHGEAWYIYPNNLQRYYLGRPADAFALMRALSLGISNADLAKIPEADSVAKGDVALRTRLSGLILLQVEANGEAWYIYPDNQRRYFLGRPEDAFRIMRELGLGITTANLHGIPVAPDSALPPEQNGGKTTVGNLGDAHDSKRTTILDGMNAERRARQIGDLALIREMNDAAQAFANDMTAHQYFDFVGPQGKEVRDWLNDAGYDAHTIATNLVQTNRPVAEIVSIWETELQSSFAHVISTDYRHVGIGVGSFQQVPIYVVVFAYSMPDFFSEQTAELADLNGVRQEMLALVNQARAAQGLPSLVMNGQLNTAAQGHANDMLSRSYYGHESPEGTAAHQRIAATGYQAMASGENIAKGQFSVQEVMDGWMNSEGHRANILNSNFEEVGFGLAFGQNLNGYEIIWVQNFGKPLL